MKNTPKAHINGLHVGDLVTFYTQGEERSVTGRITKLTFGKHQMDYASITLNVDGMSYEFGTGGHLGLTWTTESGREQWFCDSAMHE